MNLIRQSILPLILVITVTSIVISQTKSSKSKNKEWLTDVNEAYKQSKKKNVPILANFTGSDWCGWCIRLKKVAFDKPKFKEWAKTHVILLELDFPKRKKLPDNIIKQNRELAQVFGVRGYPTIWIFNMEKEKDTDKFSINGLGKAGYPSGTQPGKEVDKFIADLNQILLKAKSQ